MLESKKIIIDIGHPSEVHHYKLVYQMLRDKGWRCLFIAKDKDVILALLKACRLPHVVMAKNRGGLFSKVLQLPRDLCRFFLILKRFHPRLVISAVSVHASWISALLRIPHLAFIDTEPRKFVDLLTLPFVQAKVTAHSYYRDLGARQVRYTGNHELAYLHPLRFRPDAAVRRELGLEDEQPFVIVRFVAWKAFHDWGLRHMKSRERVDLVQEILHFRRVFITSEDKLPKALQPFLFPLPPHRILDALACADLYVGEGITMASEAVTLGTPAVLLNSMKMGYCVEAQKYGMLFRYDRLSPEALQKIKEMLLMPRLRASFTEQHRRLLADKIDVSTFTAWFIDAYPHSFREMKASTQSESRFR